MSSPSSASSFSTALRMPRSMFVPWSPSPIAVSSLTSSARCSATSAAKRAIQARTSVAVMLTRGLPYADLSAGVSTGASHSRVSSSSSLSSVIEQPAISSDVM